MAKLLVETYCDSGFYLPQIPGADGKDGTTVAIQKYMVARGFSIGPVTGGSLSNGASVSYWKIEGEEPRCPECERTLWNEVEGFDERGETLQLELLRYHGCDCDEREEELEYYSFLE